MGRWIERSNEIENGFLQEKLEMMEKENKSPSLQKDADEDLPVHEERTEGMESKDAYYALPPADNYSPVGGILDEDTHSLYHILSLVHGSPSLGFSNSVVETIALTEQAEDLIKQLGHDRDLYKLDEIMVNRLKMNIETIASFIQSDEYMKEHFEKALDETKKAALIGRKARYAESHFYEPFVAALHTTIKRLPIDTRNATYDEIKEYVDQALALRRLAKKLSGTHGLGDVLPPINRSIDQTLYTAIENAASSINQGDASDDPAVTYREARSLAKWGRKVVKKIGIAYGAQKYDTLLLDLKEAKINHSSVLRHTG